MAEGSGVSLMRQGQAASVSRENGEAAKKARRRRGGQVAPTVVRRCCGVGRAARYGGSRRRGRTRVGAAAATCVHIIHRAHMSAWFFCFAR